MAMSLRMQGAALAGVVILLDQLSKIWLIGLLNLPGKSIEITSFFKLVMVWNYGISFGMLGEHNMPYWLAAMALAISVFLARWLWQVENRMLALALGLVIGGALGNVVDRLRFGAVADFFYLHAGDYYWPAFNIADSAICIGVALLCWDSMFGNHDKTDDKTKTDSAA